MKRFEFALDRVRRWRHEQAGMEELKLLELHRELDRLTLQRKSLEAESHESEQALRSAASISAEDLRHIDGFKQYVRAQSQKLELLQRQCQTRIGQQRQRLTEALRQAELLDRLKAQAFADWRSAHQKEEEALAAELFLAKRKRPYQ